MPFQVFRYPSIPTTAKRAGRASELLGLKLGAQRACLDSLLRVIRAKPSGLIAARAIRIDELNEPARRILFPVERCHRPQCSLCSKFTALTIYHYIRN
jgi:hypothetical protein